MGTKIVYNHKAIEKKWREKWEETPVNPRNGKDGNKKPKYYCLDMFPYPSGNGLHVGHWRGYVISDVWSRYKLQQGYYIVHPMGWDAFGLPAENYAIKMGVHPAVSTAANIKNIKRQINDIAAIYDWDMEVNTTDPEFYKWTQWIFVKMFKEGLAYEKEFPINWCPSCKTGLANEEVVNGCCERCGTPVTKKNLRQWMLRITKYADRLLSDLDKLDWPEKVKKMQTDWIGKSYGAEVDFPVEGREEKITVYTTRPDTLHGATFMVLAPEHALAKSLATDETREAVEKYIFDASMKSNVDRLQDKEKTGVFTGTYAINPLNGEKLPIWLSDYVLADYGTGAIMCVPAHDDRDFEFAKKFDIPIIQVIAKDGKEIQNMTEAYTEASGTMINSGEWNGMESSVLKKEAPDAIVVIAFGQLLSKEILDLPKYGCVNIHASLLPKYRGAAPIQWAVIDGEKETGVTTMMMDVGLDTGDILETKVIPLDPKETSGSLFEKLSEAGGPLILSTLEKLEKGTITGTPQGEEGTCYAKMLTKTLGNINWTMSAAAIERLVRGLNPWPSAYTFYNGKTLKIWDADVLEEAVPTDAVPGQVLQADKHGFTVATGEGILKINELQLEGKKRMAADALLRGFTITPGEILGHQE